MIRLFLSLLLAGIVFYPALGSAGETNSTGGGDYVLGEYVFFSFSDAMAPDELANNTVEANRTTEPVNQTRRGGEMSARKLFELKQAAREDFRVMGNNESLELSTGLSPTAAQSVAIVCKQCVPEKTKI